MNWGQIQIESLKKMFLNNEELEISKLDDYKQNKKYKTYLYAMPQACNEAINYIIENGKPLIKSYKLKYKENTTKYNLNQLIPNFKRIYQIVFNGDKKPEFYVEGNNYLVVPEWKKEDGEFTIYYESYHDIILSSSSVSTDIELDNQLVSLIPLYIAGELYKDDDIQLSTIYMNEFVTSVSNIAGKDFNPNPTEINSVYSMVW